MVMTSPRPPAETAAPAAQAAPLLDRPLLAGVRVDRELVAYGLLVLLALVLRLVTLGDKPFHHDESQDAYFSWVLFTGGGYKYDPLLHGPLRFYLISLMYLLFGVSNFTARLAPALMGTAMVALPYFLRRQVGRLAAFVTAALLCLTPAYLYFSRFTREDIYFACLTLALLVGVFCFLERPRPWQPALIFGLLAASFATKETTYITVFVAGTFFLLALLVQVLQARSRDLPAGSAPLLVQVRSVGLDAWVWGFATFVAVFTVLFTTFFTNPHGLQDGLVKSISYWLSQHQVGRGDEPWYYYLVLLPAYDWPELLIGAIGLVVVLRRPTLLGAFLVWSFLLSLGVYSWAGEKMPWLLLHPLLPLLFLAGLGAQELWRYRRRPAGMAGLAAAALGAVYLLHATSAVSYAHPADPAELLVYTQSSTAVPQVVQQIMAVDRRVVDATDGPGGPQHLKLDLDTTDGVDWPWAWYLRDLKTVAFVDMSDPNYAPSSAQALLIDDANRSRLLPQLANYTGYRFPMRVWWIPEYQTASLADWWHWLVWRTPWNPEGSLDEWLYVRNDTPGAAIIGGAAATGATGTLGNTTPPVPAGGSGQAPGAGNAAAPAGQGAAKAGGQAAALPKPTSVSAARILTPKSGSGLALGEPRQLTVLADGSILVVDQATSTVTKLHPDGSVAATYAGSGDTALKNPTGLAVDSHGNVFVADTWNHRIVKLDAGLHFVAKWGGYASTNGLASGHPGEFYGPRAVAIDAKDNVYVSDTGNKRIQEFDDSGKFLAQFGGVGGQSGHLNEPVGIAFAPDGNLVVADTWNGRLQVLTATGQPVAQWPVSSWQPNVHDEPYVAVGQDGVIYVSDFNANRLLVYSAQGQPLAVWTLAGTAFNQPAGLAVGPNNEVYVADSLNHRIVVLAGK